MLNLAEQVNCNQYDMVKYETQLKQCDVTMAQMGVIYFS